MSYERYIEILDMWCDVVCSSNDRAEQTRLIVKNNPITRDEINAFFACKDTRITLIGGNNCD